MYKYVCTYMYVCIMHHSLSCDILNIYIIIYITYPQPPKSRKEPSACIGTFHPSGGPDCHKELLADLKLGDGRLRFPAVSTLVSACIIYPLVT